MIDEYGKILKFNRRTARDTAFKYLFIKHITNADMDEITEPLSELSFRDEDKAYIMAAVSGVMENLGEIDEKIRLEKKQNFISLPVCAQTCNL